MDDWKKCSRCGEAKQIEDFAPRPGRRDYQAWCKECFRGYAVQWNKRRPPRKKVDIVAGSGTVTP